MKKIVSFGLLGLLFILFSGSSVLERSLDLTLNVENTAIESEVHHEEVLGLAPSEKSSFLQGDLWRIVRTILALIFVLVFIILVFVLLKRLNRKVMGISGNLRILNSINLGSKERLLVVEIPDAGKKIIVGVTSYSISKIDDILDERKSEGGERIDLMEKISEQFSISEMGKDDKRRRISEKAKGEIGSLSGDNLKDNLIERSMSGDVRKSLDVERDVIGNVRKSLDIDPLEIEGIGDGSGVGREKSLEFEGIGDGRSDPSFSLEDSSDRDANLTRLKLETRKLEIRKARESRIFPTREVPIRPFAQNRGHLPTPIKKLMEAKRD